MVSSQLIFLNYKRTLSYRVLLPHRPYQELCVCCICFCSHISNCVFVLMFPSVFVVVCLLLELCCRHSLLCHSPVKYYATTPHAQSTGLLPVPSSCEIMLPVQFVCSAVYSSSLNHTGFMESVNSFSIEIICHH